MRRSSSVRNSLITTGNDAIIYNDTLWEDARVAASSVKINPATSKPDIGAFPTGATYTKTYLFDGASRETVTFALQLSHKWKEGTILHPHVHWAATSVEVAKTVIWELNYSIANINGVFGAEVTRSGTFGAEDTVANKQILTSLEDIDGTGYLISAMIVGALSRRGDLDTYTADVALLEFDLHFEVNSPGSRELFTK